MMLHIHYKTRLLPTPIERLKIGTDHKRELSCHLTRNEMQNGGLKSQYSLSILLFHLSKLEDLLHLCYPRIYAEWQSWICTGYWPIGNLAANGQQHSQTIVGMSGLSKCYLLNLKVNTIKIFLIGFKPPYSIVNGGLTGLQF